MIEEAWQSTDAAPRDRWLLSYADLVTLLLAFFVVMYSVSAVNEAKLSELASTLSASFDPSQSVEAQIPVQTVPEAVVAELRTLSNAEMSLVQSGSEQGLKISLPGELLFASGTADLSDPGLNELRKLMPTLELVTDRIVVEGHTDNEPIATAQFPSNWELSAQRAARVVRQIESWGVNAGLMATGLSDSQPIVSNETIEGRRQNRRVVFYVSGIDWSELSEVTSRSKQIEQDSDIAEPSGNEEILDIDDVDPELLEQVLRQLEAEGN